MRLFLSKYNLQNLYYNIKYREWATLYTGVLLSGLDHDEEAGEYTWL